MEKLFSKNNKNNESVLSVIKSVLSVSLIFLFPLFFLPFTQEFFTTNKLYLLAGGSLLLLLISTLQFLVSKKLVWQKQPIDTLIFLFLMTIGLSILLSSPNKIQALLNPNFGLVMMISLAVLYFYLSRAEIIGGAPGRAGQSLLFLQTSSFILSLFTIIFFFQPFKNINLSQNFAFLKNPAFTPIGSQLDLAIWLGFVFVIQIAQILTKKPVVEEKSMPSAFPQSVSSASFPKSSVLFVFFKALSMSSVFLALSLTLYSLLKPISPNNQSLITNNLLLPPFHLSWYAAVETLKNPLTAIFGIGVDNFSSIFTRVKDLAYNQSPLWQINSFNVSRSAVLHLFTETGLLGMAAFGLLLSTLIRELTQIKTRIDANKFLIFYILFFMLFFPPSLISWFLFFIILAQLSRLETTNQPSIQNEIDLKNLTPIYLSATIISFLFIAGSAYFLGRAYAAELSFKKSLDGIVKDNIKELYDNQKQAVILNPYNERFRLSFSQTNFLVANNIASKTASPSAQLSEQDRQAISQGIQTAINEAKSAVTLNPQKANYWENLAFIYRNIINFAQGADAWTISSYQRAIVLDPQNPNYRLNLGGIYYFLNNWDEAINLFNQSISLKPDWPNAYYNLAWASYQKGDYQRAVNAMQNVLNILDAKTNKTDYEKAQKELEEFKKKLPKTEEEATPAGQIKESQLTLPTPPAAQISPKIELPKEASPEAR